MTTAKCMKCGSAFPVHTIICGSAFSQCPYCGSHGPVEWVVPSNLVMFPTATINMLKTVDEHNAQKRQAREEREHKARLTGVACPKCGGELEWIKDYCRTYLDWQGPPTTTPARCGPCNLTVELER